MSGDKRKELRNCKKCNRLFSSEDGSTLCSRCNDSIDNTFNRVREYIYDNPTSSVKDVSAGTGVSTDAILKWIREGKIILGDHARIAFCERCGAGTEGDRYCAKCLNELSSGFKSSADEAQEQDKPFRGMHIKEGSSRK